MYLTNLIEHISARANVNLREFMDDTGRYFRDLIPPEHFTAFYAFYGLTPHHRLHFKFSESNISGSYFLGQCEVARSIIYKSDVRGDELRHKGDVVDVDGIPVRLNKDEVIKVEDSYLYKTLVHNNSHDPENLEEFIIKNTVAMHWANIHGSPMHGCFLGPFATVDLSCCRNCVIGNFAYVQAGELNNHYVQPGHIWIRSAGNFEFSYRYEPEVLRKYLSYMPGQTPGGLLMDYMELRQEDFWPVYMSVPSTQHVPVPNGASLSPYAVVKGQTRLGENVLVSQRAYLEEAWLGKGANAQENCYIVQSSLEGYNVTAHGGKIIHAHLKANVFVGFNSFVHGNPETPLQVGEGSIVMPHTIIDAQGPLEIPAKTLVWGLIQTQEDLAENSISLEKLAESEGDLEVGRMSFEGSGKAFVDAFAHRIQHILEENGAYWNGRDSRGHSQRSQDMSFNIVQPYMEGKLKGIYPTVDISPASGLESTGLE